MLPCSGVLLNTKILVCTGDVSFDMYAVNVSTLIFFLSLSGKIQQFEKLDWSQKWQDFPIQLAHSGWNCHVD